MFIVNDQNYREVMKRSEDAGMTCGLRREPWAFESGNLPGAPVFSEAFPLVPRGEWVARAKAREERPLARLIRQAGIPTFNQNGTNWCWAHASTKAACAALAVQGAPLVLAPESVAGPASGWRNVGGTLSEGFEQLRTGGACTRDFVLRANTVSRSALKEGWEQNALLHRADEQYSIVGPKVWDQIVTACFEGFAVAFGVAWWSHALCYLDPVVMDNGQIGMLHDNSHGTSYGEDGLAVFAESRGTPETGWGVIAYRTMLYLGQTPPPPPAA